MSTATVQPANGLDGVLRGVTVLDFTQVLSGPYCTMMLADHGADVLKVEPPEGDLSRSLGPWFKEDTERRQGGYFHSVNRNKRSLVLDLKQPGDCAIARDLAARVDVVVENYRAGVMDRLGLSYEILRERNPRLIYAAIRGFGDPRTGDSPYMNWPAFDIVAQAMSGFMSVTGPGTPMKAGPGIGDIVPGIMLAFGIVAALRHAERSGSGQFLDVAMYDAMIGLCERIVYQHSVTGRVPGAEGNEHPLVCPFSIFEASDGWIAIGCPIEAQWRTLAGIIGRADMLSDERFASNPSRVTHGALVRAAITAWSGQRTRAECAVALGGKVPFGPVNDISDIMADTHVGLRGMAAPLALPELGRELTVAGVPVHFAQTPGGVHRRGANLGEHTREILDQFGIAGQASVERSR